MMLRKTQLKEDDWTVWLDGTADRPTSQQVILLNN